MVQERGGKGRTIKGPGYVKGKKTWGVEEKWPTAWLFITSNDV